MVYSRVEGLFVYLVVSNLLMIRLAEVLLQLSLPLMYIANAMPNSVLVLDSLLLLCFLANVRSATFRLKILYLTC